MRLTKKLWLWVFEFKLKRVKDDDKIAFLAKKLLSELERQGYSLRCTDEVYGVDVNVYMPCSYRKEPELHVSNIHERWEVQCGNYPPIVKGAGE